MFWVYISIYMCVCPKEIFHPICGLSTSIWKFKKRGGEGRKLGSGMVLLQFFKHQFSSNWVKYLLSKVALRKRISPRSTLSYEEVAKHPSPKEESKPRSIREPKSPGGAFHNIVLHLIATEQLIKSCSLIRLPVKGPFCCSNSWKPDFTGLWWAAS